MELFSLVMTFPFEQIASGLRSLALSGPFGNGAAVMIYVLICLLPAVWGLYRKEYPLCGLSVLLFPMFYMMINLPTGDSLIMPVVKSMLCGLIWSGIVCVGVLKLLKLFKNGKKEQLFGYMRILLYILCVVFVGAITASFIGLVETIREAQKSMDRFMAIICFLNAVLPYGMDILVTVFGWKLVDQVLLDDRAATEEMANRLADFACVSLAMITISGVVLNALQLIFMAKLSDVNVSVEIPFFSLAFALTMLLVARLISENRRLADDNDLFI